MAPLEVAVSTIENIDNAATVRAALMAATVKTVVYEGFQTIGAYRRAYGEVAEGELLLLVNGAINALLASASPSDQAKGLSLKTYSDRFLLVPGLPLDDDATRADLNVLLPIIGPDRLAKLLALGATYTTPLAAAGYEGTPTVEQVETTCVIVRRKRLAKDWVTRLKDEVLGNNGNGHSVEELKQLVQEFE